MSWLRTEPMAVLSTLVTNVRADPVWWSVVAGLVALGLLAIGVLLLFATYRRVVRLQRLTRGYFDQDAHAAIEHLSAVHYYLRDLDEKVGSSLPPDVRVASIKADNLVVQPPNGERLTRDFR
jgi:hypothetical protein